MQLTVKGKQLDVGDALRSYVKEQLGTLAEKYFSNPINATVLFSQEAHLYRADISVRVGRGILLQASAEATDIYPAFDAAAEKVGKRLRRYKRRLRAHHMSQTQTTEVVARQYVIEADRAIDDGEETGTEPVIIAEMDTTIETMSVAEAVMRMDLAELTVFLFRNGAQGGLNMIYRRSDGHVGWIDTNTGDGSAARMKAGVRNNQGTGAR